MSIVKSLIKSGLRKKGLELRWTEDRLQAEAKRQLNEYIKGGSKPWSPGYGPARTAFLRNILQDKALLDCFRNKKLLPLKYGKGFDERCVEIPWLAVQLENRAVRILDAGSALNHDYILNYIISGETAVHIMTLAPENNRCHDKNVSYLFGDLREIPTQDKYYDFIACVSTLEHIGMNNVLFTDDVKFHEQNHDDFKLVMKELRRVLVDGGVLCLTVPYGVYQVFGGFQQFDRKLLNSAIESFGFTSAVDETFFRYTKEGWQVATPEECANCEYVSWLDWTKGIPAPVPVEPDLAAAARAVACIKLIKK